MVWYGTIPTKQSRRSFLCVVVCVLTVTLFFWFRLDRTTICLTLEYHGMDH